MNKTQIDLNILLPGLPDEKDECVDRIVAALKDKRGIDRVHVVPAKDDSKAHLCFHYNPDEIAIKDVEHLARNAGAAISEQYGHLLLMVSGIRHPRHARIIEAKIKDLPGIISVSVSGNGYIQLEFEKAIITRQQVLDDIKNMRLAIKTVEDFHAPSAPLGHKITGQENGHEGHGHAPGKDHEDGHAHGGIFGERTELIFAIICGFFLALGFGLSYVEAVPDTVSIILYVIAYFFGGFYTSKEAYAGISKGHFEIDFLMLVAALGAAILGEWAEGALLLFLFSLGHALEHYAMDKAKKSITALTALAPKTALLKTGNDVKEIAIEALEKGDIIVVKPNSKIAADGFVVQGSSSVNQAPITGESIPVDKRKVNDANMSLDKADTLDAAFRVFAGSINGGGTLEIKVSRLAEDSTISRLVKLVNEAQTQKSPTQNLADRVEKYYVPAVLILVTLLLFAFLVIDENFSESFYRAMAVLVAASPCALAISTPSAVLSGIARAARGGVLIKGGKPLEDLGSLKAIAFDKTGTLTVGKPRLTGVYPLNGITMQELLQVVIAVEKLSDHPLAAAIVKDGLQKLGSDVQPASNLQSITGRGVQATYGDLTVHVGNAALFQEKAGGLPAEIALQVEELETAGNTTMIVQQGEKFLGIITLMDVVRDDAKETLAALGKMGIRKMIMLTGDNQEVANAIAKELGLTEARGDLLPEQKIAAIDELKLSEKKVAMVGDGVNDAPAMAKSTVGIAMGAAGSDVALETADIALMADQLSNLPFAIGLSKKAHSIIKQNLVISIGMVALLIPLTITGYASIGPAVVGHEGSTLVVVFNALRLLAYKK
jgi:Zn2+/Cd2+-exporting ATPase